MPELPEVETVKRGLEPHFSGAVIETVEQRRENLRFAFPDQFTARLAGRTCDRLERRAKYLIAYLDSGEALVMHLGMSGRFTVELNSPEIEGSPLANSNNPAHDHVVFHLSGGEVVRYNDPRRFGYMDLVDARELTSHKYFKALGPEPLGNEFHEDYLRAVAGARKTPLKSFLLDQRVVAGLGNIYVLEALHEAGLSPLAPAKVLAAKRGAHLNAATRIVAAIRSVLEKAILAGGSTLKDYAKADGSMGYFQHSFQVYGRGGEICLKPSCGGIIKRVVQSGRSSFYCPRCQKT